MAALCDHLRSTAVRKSGARVVSVPSMAEIWRRAGADKAILDSWLVLRVQSDDVHCYEVLSKADG